jgi:transposase
MLRDLSSLSKIYIACGRTDLRKGIDGLATLVKEQFQLDPFQKDVLFLFCGTRKDRFKGLVWEGDVNIPAK